MLESLRKVSAELRRETMLVTEIDLTTAVMYLEQRFPPHSNLATIALRLVTGLQFRQMLGNSTGFGQDINWKVSKSSQFEAWEKLNGSTR